MAQSKFFLQNINILTKLTKKYYKFQNRSQKKSQSCVPLRDNSPSYGILRGDKPVTESGLQLVAHLSA
jgi:hypothetical protein